MSSSAFDSHTAAREQVARDEAAYQAERDEAARKRAAREADLDALIYDPQHAVIVNRVLREGILKKTISKELLKTIVEDFKRDAIGDLNREATKKLEIKLDPDIIAAAQASSDMTTGKDHQPKHGSPKRTPAPSPAARGVTQPPASSDAAQLSPLLLPAPAMIGPPGSNNVAYSRSLLATGKPVAGSIASSFILLTAGAVNAAPPTVAGTAPSSDSAKNVVPGQLSSSAVINVGTGQNAVPALPVASTDRGLVNAGAGALVRTSKFSYMPPRTAVVTTGPGQSASAVPSVAPENRYFKNS